MKKWLLFCISCFSILIVKQVDAGTLSWTNSKRLSPNSFELYLEATDLNLNYLSGTWEVTNGKITKIVMHDGWINQSGISNTFYYYRDGIQKGNYRIATITIELTSDSTTKMHNTDIGVKRCSTDSFHNFFNKNGNLVSQEEYTRVCFSSDATLKDLSISSGTLTPTFQSQLNLYQATVEHNVDQVSFSPILNDSKAHVISETTCRLTIGENVCQIIVEAENKTRNTYTVLVTRKKDPTTPSLSHDATLKSLSSDVGILSPTFQANHFQYSTQVPNRVEKINFYPIVNHSKAKIVSNTTCSLRVGINTCEIIVEAEDQSRNRYVIQVTRDDTSDENPNPSNDATLKHLVMNQGEFTPKFQPTLFHYSAVVSNPIEFVIFSPTTNHEKATIISGLTCQLEIGVNHCQIVIEAENGNRATYTIDVTREKKPENLENEMDTSIRDFTIHNGTLTEKFDENRHNYVIQVLEGTKTIVFQYIMNANNHQYIIPYEIDYSNLSYDLVITSLNQQKQETYHFSIQVISSSNNGDINSGNNNNDNNIIDNPQTGDSISFFFVISFIGFSLLGIIFLRKKSIIRTI